MEYVNELYKTGAAKEDLVVLAKLLKPFAPHLASEMLEKLGADDEWPKWDEKYLVSDTATVVVQVNGKLRAKLEVSADDLEDEETFTSHILRKGMETALIQTEQGKIVFILCNRFNL